jgi:O-antigen ligase
VAVLLLIGVAGTLASEGSWVAVATYPNAAGALALQGALAAGMLAVLGASRLRRMVSAAVALAFAFSGFLSGSVAASVLIGACALALAISGTARATRVLATVAVVGFLAAFLTTIVLGRSYSPASASSGAERRAADALSSRRLSLWHNALEMMTERPAFGIGPGRFQFEHRPAARDRDARWAHDEFLQRGAETGVFGLLLGVALLVWALLRLGWASPNHPIAVIGIAAVGALAVHACVDHVLHDPVLPAVAAALGGFAAGTVDRRGAALTSTRLGWGRA